VIGVGVVGIDRQRAVVVGDGAVELALLLVGVAAVAVGLIEVR
jgi:hypothetical protein